MENNTEENINQIPPTPETEPSNPVPDINYQEWVFQQAPGVTPIPPSPSPSPSPGPSPAPAPSPSPSPTPSPTPTPSPSPIPSPVTYYLYSWGRNTEGELANNAVTSQAIAVQEISYNKYWTSISSTYKNSTYAITLDGTLWSWGANNLGQLGNDSVTHRSSPVQVGNNTNWRYVSGGYSHAAGLKTDGTLWTWGNNSKGQLGKNDITHRSSPIQVGTDTNWLLISCGYEITLGIKGTGSAGTLWGWGSNTNGGLGVNTAIANYSSPVQVGALSTWSNLYAGFNSCAALQSDYSLWTWGKNTNGQLGDGTIIHRSSPVQISGSYLQGAIGYNHMAFIKSDYSAWLWGSNTSGQLGDNTIAHRSSPVQTVAAGTTWTLIKAFGDSTVSIKSDGNAYTWGNNNDSTLGSIGVASGVHKSSPVQVQAFGLKWVDVSGGKTHVSALTLSSSNLYLSGVNNYGQLGDNTQINRDFTNLYQTVAGDVNWQDIVAGDVFAAATKNDGTLWMWGGGNNGVLGNNSSTHRSSPVQVLGTGSGWTNISAGDSHAGGTKKDGTLWMWGFNGTGQLGDNTTSHRSSPVQIGNNTNWQSINCGAIHSLAIKTDGTLWGWGYSLHGELGNNQNVHRSSPVQVGADSSWAVASAGQYLSAAIKKDGTLWTWGVNWQGTLGNNSTLHRSSPVQVGTDATWASLNCGDTHMASIKTDGTLWLWGANASGRLGDNTVTSRSSPVQTVAGGTNWRQVDCAQTTTVAVKQDGTLWKWGWGYGTSQSSPVQIVAGGKTWSKAVSGNSFIMALIDTTQPSPKTSTMFWPDPVPKASGYALNAETLNASVLADAGGQLPGSIIYDPAKGTVLSVGTHTLTATSLLNDYYNQQTISRTITIT